MSVAHQSWENRPGPMVGYQVAAHRPHYAGGGSNCRRQAQQQTSFRNPPSFNIEMHSASEISQRPKDSLAFISQGAAVPTDKSAVPLQKVSSHELLCHPTRPCGEPESCQSVGNGLAQPETTGSVAVVKSKAERKPSLQMHFEVVPQDPNKTDTRSGQGKLAKETASASSFSSSSSSSIGQVSDSSSCLTQKAPEESEVQSALRSPLEQMRSLEDSLPIKRGLSRFYNGKSRSFTSLADVSSVNDLAKPANPYAKKRKWLQGSKNDSRSHFGYPPIYHSTSNCSKKTLSSRDSLSSFSVSSGSGSEYASKPPLASAGVKDGWKDCASSR